MLAFSCGPSESDDPYQPDALKSEKGLRGLSDPIQTHW